MSPRRAPRVAEVVEGALAEEQGAEDLPDDDVRAWVAFFVRRCTTRGRGVAEFHRMAFKVENYCSTNLRLGGSFMTRGKLCAKSGQHALEGILCKKSYVRKV